MYNLSTSCHLSETFVVPSSRYFVFQPTVLFFTDRSAAVASPQMARATRVSRSPRKGRFSSFSETGENGRGDNIDDEGRGAEEGGGRPRDRGGVRWTRQSGGNCPSTCVARLGPVDWVCAGGVCAGVGTERERESGGYTRRVVHREKGADASEGSGLANM